MLLQDAASAGHALAQYHLGLALLQGHGVPQDPSQGLKLIQKSASVGLAEAQIYVREMRK